MRAFLVLFAGIFLARTALGDEKSRSAHEDARALMRQGNAAYAGGDLRLARERYLAAWQRSQGFEIACNLGRTSLDLEAYKEAARFLDYCLEHYSLSSREEVVQAEQQIRAAFTRAKSNVGKLVVRSTAGADVAVDGVSVGHAPLAEPVYVDPGTHVIQSTLAGHRASAHSSTLGAGESQTVEFLLVRDPEPPTVPAPTRLAPEPRGPSYVPALATAGLAVAGLAVGTGFLVAASAKESSREEQLGALPGASPCGAGTPHLAECIRIQHLSDDSRALRTTSFVAFGVGAAGAVATYFLWPSRRTSERTVGARVVPVFTESAAGVSALGNF